MFLFIALSLMYVWFTNALCVLVFENNGFWSYIMGVFCAVLCYATYVTIKRRNNYDR